MKIEVSEQGMEILDKKVLASHDDIVALELLLSGEGFAVTAFGDGAFPSVMLDEGGKLTKLSFPELKGYKTWSCYSFEDTLRVCLVKNRRTVNCDPPSGHLYVFPKVWDKDKDPDLKSWLVREGYPKDELERMGGHFYCRFWETK